MLIQLTVVPAALEQWPPALSSPAGPGPSAPPPLLSDACSQSPHSSAVTPAGAPAPPSIPAQHIPTRICQYRSKVGNNNFRCNNLILVYAIHLLGVDDLKSLLHLATLVTPTLLVSHQWDVGVFWDALLAVTAVHAAAVLLITQVVIAAQQRGRESASYCNVHTHKRRWRDQLSQSHLWVNFR